MIERQPEPELMDDPLEAEAYSETDFSDVNEKFAAEFSTFLPLSGELIMLDLGCGPGILLIEYISVLRIAKSLD